MSKETFYFSHDYNTRTDDKIKSLIRKHGMNGYGIFWAIVEDLYNNANALHTDYDGIAFDLRTKSEIIKSIINDFELFSIEDGSFGSISIEKRMDERNDKSEKARESAFKRWNKTKKDAKAMPTQCEGNAIKESKGKDIKEKKRNKEDFDFQFLDAKFIPVFMEWVDYKKSRNENYKTQKSLEACYRNLLRLSQNNPDKAKLLIDQAMGNNWAGIFPLKSEGQILNKGEVHGSIKYLPK